MEVTPQVNAEAIEAWNTVLFEKFCRFQHLVTAGLSQHGTEAMRRFPPSRGGRVLDVGCGFGDTTRQLAELIGPEGEAVGIDAAQRFIDCAERETREAAVPNARFFVGDVQSCDLDGPYDQAFSRFGTMFFASPVAALRNVARALRPDGGVTMVVWRRREDNEWLYAAEQCVRALVPEKHDTGAPTCGPGPFSMAGPDMVSDQLRAAGYRGITFERFDTDICIGKDLDEAVEFAMALGPAGEVVRLAGDEAERLRPKVCEALREVLASFVRSDGVHASSSTWFVHATRA